MIEGLCVFELFVIALLIKAVYFEKKQRECEKYFKELYLRSMKKAFDKRDTYIKAAEDKGISLYEEAEGKQTTLKDAIKKARGGDAPIDTLGFA